MTATDLDLDNLLDALVARARSRAEATPVVNVAGQEVSPRASTGRLVVNPGDVIASVWGNTVYDQSVQAYDNAASRDSQWPTPKDGAVCYTVDTATVWLRRAGAWAALPRGLIANSNGPPSAFNAASGTFWSWANVPVIAGRKYRFHLWVQGGQQTSAASFLYFTVGDSQSIWAGANSRFIWYGGGSPVAAGSISVSVSRLYVPTATGNVTFTMGVSTGAGTFSIGANVCEAALEDLGGS